MAALPLVLISAISNAVLSLKLSMYHEFNSLESPEKTSTFADAQGFKKEN